MEGKRNRKKTIFSSSVVEIVSDFITQLYIFFGNVGSDFSLNFFLPEDETAAIYANVFTLLFFGRDNVMKSCGRNFLGVMRAFLWPKGNLQTLIFFISIRNEATAIKP